MSREIKPIRTTADHDAMLQEIESLMGAKSGAPDADRLEVLVTLVCAYEDEHFAMDAPDPIDAIKFRMEQMGLKRADLERLIGSRGRVAEVLGRKRPLTITMMRRLHKELGVPADVLLNQPVMPKRKSRAAAAMVRNVRSIYR